MAAPDTRHGAALGESRVVSISAAPYDGYAFPVLLDSMAACGVRFVEPAFIVGYTEPFDEAIFSDANARQYRRWLEQSGLRCHAFSSHIDLGREDAVDVFTRRMEFAASLGARVINTNAASRANAARFHANIAPLARRAAALGMVIGLENPGNGEDNLINDAQEGLALIGRLDLASVRLNYDPGNTVSHRPGRIDAAADALLVLPGCAHFHVKDVRRSDAGWRFTPPGQGEIDYDTIMAAVAREATLPFAVELPLRMSRLRNAQPIRAPEPIPLPAIEAAIGACLAYVGRWFPSPA
jgi:sugar phosphate isomerase/epimerase